MSGLDFPVAVLGHELRELLAAIAPPERWALFHASWSGFMATLEHEDLAPEAAVQMLAWALGGSIGGQPDDTEAAVAKRNDALRLAWDVLLNGAEHAGMDIDACLLKRTIQI